MKSPTRTHNLTKPFAIIIFLTISFSGFSQGEFMHKGQSGIQFDGYYMEIPDEDVGGFGGKFGFSAKGTFDMQVSYNGLSTKKDASGTELKGNRVYGRMVIHILKQSDKLPFSLRGIIGGGVKEFDEIDYTRMDVDFGFGIARRNYIRDNISIVTTVDYIYRTSTIEQFGEENEVSNGLIALTLPIAFNLPHNHLVHFAPFINFGLNDSGGSLGFNLGYIIPFYGNNK